MPKGICLFSKRILIEGFSFFRGVGIPALGAEFTLLTIAELYLRPGGTVNNREKPQISALKEHVGTRNPSAAVKRR